MELANDVNSQMGRRYDIDWIRVIAFDILVVYHVGMVFVPWEFLLKNNHLVKELETPMFFVNQWRLPLLFLISGMGTWFAFGKRSSWQYVRERFARLLIPLLFGMLVVIPPQVYVERLANNMFSGSYGVFYLQLFNGIYPEGNFSWHHLWFLPYLFAMSLAALPLVVGVHRSDRARRLLAKGFGKNAFWLTVPIGVLTLVEFFLEPRYPVTYALWDDWYAFTLYFTFFIGGILAASSGEAFFDAVAKLWPMMLLCGLLFFGCILMSKDSGQLGWLSLWRAGNRVSWVLVILGLASIFLNRNSTILRYRTQTVYPLYILHQTVCLIIAFYLLDLPMSVGLKFVILLGGTFSISWILYEGVIKRISWLRPCFGLKLKSL